MPYNGFLIAFFFAHCTTKLELAPLLDVTHTLLIVFCTRYRRSVDILTRVFFKNHSWLKYTRRASLVVVGYQIDDESTYTK